MAKERRKNQSERSDLPCHKINLRTFLAEDYANQANAHGKFGTTSPQFFRKADPTAFEEDRQSIQGSNCDRSFCIQCSIDSPPSCSFQARLSGRTGADSYRVEMSNGFFLF